MPDTATSAVFWDQPQANEPRSHGLASVPGNAALAVDLGEARDFTALCTIRQVGDKFRCTHIERAPLGTPYSKVVRYVQKLMALPAYQDVDLIVDATGVGRPVAERMEEEGLLPIPVIITGGSNESHEPRDWSWRVPKKNIVTVAQICLGRDILEMPSGHTLIEQVKHELRTFKRKKNPETQNESFEAGRESDHDDLVFALCLALWHVTKYYEPVRELVLAAMLPKTDWLQKQAQEEYEQLTHRMGLNREEKELEDWVDGGQHAAW
jgi:hypothetical protein